VGPTGSVAHEPASVVLVVLLLDVLVDDTDDDVVLLDVVVVDVVVVELATVDEVVATVDVVVPGMVDVVEVLLLVDVEDVVTGGVEVVVVPPGTGPVQAENSDVSPSGAIAVAVITPPAASGGRGKVSGASPDASVTTSMAPRNVVPSPLLLASHDGLPKNSTVNVVEGRLLSVPVTCDADTMVSTG
jgi:hypothetical protein